MDLTEAKFMTILSGVRISNGIVTSKIIGVFETINDAEISLQKNFKEFVQKYAINGIFVLEDYLIGKVSTPTPQKKFTVTELNTLKEI